MAIPTWEAVSAMGTLTSGGTASPALPGAPADGDYVIVFFESANEVVAAPTFTINTTTAFTELGSAVGRGTAGVAGAIRLTMYGAFCATNAATETVNVTAGAVDHVFYRIAIVRGVDDNPYEAVGQSVDLTTTTSLAWPTGLTTTRNDALVILALALPDDSISTTKVGAVTAANLAAITERFDETTNTNVGGGLACITGTLAVAGAIGSPTATAAAATKHEYRVVALIGDTGTPLPAEPVDLRTDTKLGVKTYSGPDRAGVTRTRSANNVHFVGHAARMPPYKTDTGSISSAGEDKHYYQGTDYEGFGAFLGDIKWSELEPEDGEYNFSSIRGHLDLAAESRVFFILNFEWKHFDIPHYADVVPQYMATGNTGCFKIPYNSGDGTNTPIPGDIITQAGGKVAILMGGLKGRGTGAAATTYQATGSVWLDVIAGTFGAGNILKNGSQFATLTGAGTETVGAQIRVGDGDGFYAQYRMQFVRTRLYRIIDAICREFGHHPWFGGIEFPETAGASEDTRQPHTAKWQPGATEYVTVTANGNPFMDSEFEGAYWQEQVYGRFFRDSIRRWPSVVFIAGCNLFPGRNSDTYNLAFENIFTPAGDDMPDTFTHPNLVTGGVDIFYESPGRISLSTQSYPMYTRHSSGKAMKGDGTAHTDNAVKFSDMLDADTGAVDNTNGTLQRYYHKNSMQFDSKKNIESGGLSMTDMSNWAQDFMRLQMIQWNYEKGPDSTTQQYDFGDLKAAANDRPTLTPSVDANGRPTYTPPSITRKTFGAASTASFTGVTGTYFPPANNNEAAGWTMVIGFRVSTLSGNQDIFRSDVSGGAYTWVYVNSGGDLVAKIYNGSTTATLTSPAPVVAGKNFIAVLLYEARRGSTAGDPDGDNGVGFAPQTIDNGYRLYCHDGSTGWPIQRSTAVKTRHLGTNFVCWGGANVTAGTSAGYDGGQIAWRSIAGETNKSSNREMSTALKVSTVLG